MGRLQATAALVVVLSMAAGPVMLDRCLIACDAVPQRAVTSEGHCHADHQGAQTAWTATNRCNHDHGTLSAIPSLQGRGESPLRLHQLESVNAFDSADLSPDLRRRPASTDPPPPRRARPDFVRPLRV